MKVIILILMLVGIAYAEPPLYTQLPTDTELFTLQPKEGGSPSGYGATWADDSQTITRGELESLRHERRQREGAILREMEYQNQLTREQNELIEQREFEQERLRLYGRQ